jgi:hypothetical protein
MTAASARPSWQRKEGAPSMENGQEWVLATLLKALPVWAAHECISGIIAMSEP